MAAKSQRAASRLPATGYWQESMQPLMSLAFVAPLLIGYEAGVVYLGPHAIRNAADVWLRGWLDLAGFSQYLLLPVLICALLLAWHHASRQPWRVDFRVVRVMWLEASLLALALLLAAQLQARIFDSYGLAQSSVSLATDSNHTAARVVGYLGAGIYEEFFFRLILLTSLGLLLQTTGLNRRGSLLAAVVATSLLFAAAHYRIDVILFDRHWTMPHGDAFTWFSFLFRFCAGAVFALLFAFRGFGIAVGTHALYDLMIVLL